ncbi:zinc finger and SCAN domain-containing protein 29-like [Macrochelys suwanniensis]
MTVLDSTFNSDGLASTQEKHRELLNFISCLISVARSAAQVAMQSQNRKRAPAWIERETLDLIAVWGEESVQADLRSSRRNADIYAKIAQGIMKRGYTGDAQQCHMKIKELRQAYQKTKEINGHSWSEPQTCRFYDQLHAIQGGDPTSTPTLSVDTKMAASGNTDEDFVDEEEEEENAQQASRESVLPGSQDLFLTLEPIPSQSLLFLDPDGGEGNSAANVSMLTASTPSLRLSQIRRQNNAPAMTCFQSSCSPPTLIGHS